MKIKSMKGREVDMSLFVNRNPTKRAVGGTMNARGDRVDTRGNVVMSAAQTAKEYHRNNPNAVRTVSARELMAQQTFITPEEVAKTRKVEHTPSKKLTDSED